MVLVGVGCMALASSTCYAGTIYACKKKVGGAVRIVGAQTKCLATETKIAWPDAAEIAAVKKRLAALESLLQHFSRSGNNISIDGANLWITDGSGSTDGSVNGLGNLIIGYNAARDFGNVRSGSHNLVIGDRQNYSSFGGLIAGYQNETLGEYASVCGGSRNLGYGAYSSVSGGSANVAGGSYSSVSGGNANNASGLYSSVSGGTDNTSAGESASTSGGFNRDAPGAHDWRGGGLIQDQ